MSKESSAVAEKKEKDNEGIFTVELLKPIALIAGYLYLLKQMAQSLELESMVLPFSDPFKKVWWSGPAVFSVLYLCFVFLGQKFMANRNEFKIKPFIFTYNLYQCLLNIWCVYSMLQEVFSNPWFNGRIWGNTPQPNQGGFRIAFLVWVHYNNKYLELLDTVFMILRKKNNQVSFLHCYHHVLLIWAWFLVCKVEAGGDSYFGAMINSAIHVIMYGYYTLALLNISCPWKKWITTCQMIQFCVCLSHSIYVTFIGKNAPIILPLAQAFVMINMLVLFGNFYKKTYAAKDDKKKDS